MAESFHSRDRLLLLVFLLSGVTALAYQVMWVRQISLVLGSTIYAVSAVVSAFMGGLALGSRAFGSRADSSSNPLRLYALLEVGIGLSALILPWGLRAVETMLAASPLLQGSAAIGSVVSFVFSAGLLLVPTSLMGGTLPVLSRYLSGSRPKAAPAIGWLYAINTVGGIIGAAAAGFFCIRWLGITRTTQLAAVANFVIAAWALLLARAPFRGLPSSGSPSSDAAKGSLLHAIGFAFFLNGFVGLGLEVLWTRAILMLTANTVYAFTIILVTFLAGLALGSAIMSAALPRTRRHGAWLAAMMCALGLVAALTPLVMSQIGWHGEPGLEANVHGPVSKLQQCFGISLLLIFPASLVLGACFPLVVSCIANERSQIGKSIGSVYALNTIGAVLGCVAAPLLIRVLGIDRSILLAAAIVLAGALVVAQVIEAKRFRVVAALLLIGTALSFYSSPPYVRRLLERSLEAPLRFYEEGVDVTVGVYESDRARRPVLMINNTALSDRGVVHKLLAHVPAMIHPAPRRALVVGFGVGISSQSLAAHAIPVNDCVEISSSVMEAAEHFAALNGNIAGRGDPSFQVFIDDGRRFLLRTQDPYDLIVLDANSGTLRNAGVGKLYTREFFRLCRSRLGPQGLVSLYMSPNGSLQENRMITRTFREVFPHTTAWIDIVFGQTCMLLGSTEPVQVDVGRYLRRLKVPAVRADLAVFDLDQPGALLAGFLMGENRCEAFSRGGELNTDDRPIMEFYPLRTRAFDRNDDPFWDHGFSLYRDRIEPLLVGVDGSEDAAEVMRFLAASDRSFECQRVGWLFERQGDRRGAQNFLDLAHQIHPEAEYLRALTGCGREDLASAERRAARSTDPADLVRLGRILSQRGDHERAVFVLEPALGPAVRDSTALLDLAVSLHETGRRDEAVATLERARRAGLDPAFLEAQQWISRTPPEWDGALSRLRAGVERGIRVQDTYRIFEAALAIDSNRGGEPFVSILLARCLLDMGDYVGALAHSHAAWMFAPQDRRLERRFEAMRLEVGIRAAVGGRSEGARSNPEVQISSFTGERLEGNIVPRIDPADPRPWLELARFYAQEGDFAMAYRRARGARTLAPRLLEAYLTIGKAAVELKAPQIAAMAYKEALALDSSVSEARDALLLLHQAEEHDRPR